MIINRSHSRGKANWEISCDVFLAIFRFTSCWFRYFQLTSRKIPGGIKMKKVYIVINVFVCLQALCFQQNWMKNSTKIQDVFRYIITWRISCNHNLIIAELRLIDEPKACNQLMHKLLKYIDSMPITSPLIWNHERKLYTAPTIHCIAIITDNSNRKLQLIFTQPYASLSSFENHFSPNFLALPIPIKTCPSKFVGKFHFLKSFS